MIDNFSSTISRDFFHLITGERIGYGCSREVYSCSFDPSIVIKFEEGGKSFANVQEWENWKNFEFSETIKKWLAPCVDISPCGAVLIMRKTKPLVEYPEKLPAFLTDRKPSNFGVYDGRLVCHDYPYFIHNLKTHLTKADFQED